MKNFLINLRDHHAFLGATIAEMESVQKRLTPNTPDAVLVEKWLKGLYPVHNFLYELGNLVHNAVNFFSC